MENTAIKITTEWEYLEIDRNSVSKHEFHYGEIYAMSGASRKHNLLVSSLIYILENHLREQKCEVYPSDMKVRVTPQKNYYYPDVMVVCDEPKFFDAKEDILENPSVIIEVLSDSTEKFDRTHKFDEYKKLPSLKEYVLVSQDKPKIELFGKNGKSEWIYSETSEQVPYVTLLSIDFKLQIQEVYKKVF